MPADVYAEYLPKIHSLSIQVSLSSTANSTTEASISSDGSTFTICHEGQDTCIDLPVIVSRNTRGHPLPITTQFKATLEYRLSLDAKSADDGILTESVGNDNIVIPWTATSLSHSSEVSCKVCSIPLIPRGKVRHWRDLPSENWAEMMDLWYCHRPDETNSRNHEFSKKGFAEEAAGFRLSVTPTIGLVDAVTFLVHADDCQNIEFPINSSEDHTAENLLSCRACGTLIGVLDVETQGYRLLKSALAVSSSVAHSQHALKIAQWLSCRLLTAQASQGVNKFVIRCNSNRVEPLLVWVFTPDLAISSSTATRPGPFRVMRIYWKDVPHDHDSTRLDKQSLSEGELEIPSFELESLRTCLQESAKVLPQNLLRLPGWQVGLLQRF